MFSQETIRNMFSRNPDGAGLMYYEAGKVHCIKGFMKVEDLLAYLRKYDFTYTNLVLHFRIGTSGLIDKLNCHPYPIFDENEIRFDTDLAMMHNGVMRNYSPGFYSDINDTQLFIDVVLSHLNKNFLKDRDKRMLIEELIPNNKLCFLNSKNEVVTLGNGWIEENGYLFSNSSYQRRIQTGLFSEFDDFDIDKNKKILKRKKTSK